MSPSPPFAAIRRHRRHPPPPPPSAATAAANADFEPFSIKPGSDLRERLVGAWEQGWREQQQELDALAGESVIPTINATKHQHRPLPNIFHHH